MQVRNHLNAILQHIILKRSVDGLTEVAKLLGATRDSAGTMWNYTLMTGNRKLKGPQSSFIIRG
jgi:hypothetical protein